MDNIVDIYELSPMQQGMLFHTLYEPDSGVYFEQRSCLLEGKINTANFKKSWQQIVDRYSILRTAFYWEELDKPLQVVAKEVELPWIEEDWSHLSELKQETALEKWLTSDRDRGFIINEAPLMRCALIKLAQDKYRFIWSYHHILMDGWCNGILIKEVFTVYEALNRGESLYLEPPRPYRNYISWLQEQDQENAKNYWKENLAGFTEPTNIPTDKKNNQSDNIAEVRINLNQEITAKLIAFANQNRITLNSIIQGAWALLLSRYCDSNDLVFGATVSGRPPDLVGVESIVGLFINTLPVRVKLSPQLDLITYLQQIHAQQIIREQYSYSALTDIKNWSEIPQDITLFDSLVILENHPFSLDELPKDSGGFTISDLQVLYKSNFPLILSVFPGEELLLIASYDTACFTSDIATRILESFQYLLTQITSNSLQKVEDLSVLTIKERKLLASWQQNQVDYLLDKTVPQLFQEQVDKTPDVIAVKFKEQELTYSELNQKANQLAHHLQILGVGPEVLVGICVERSVEMVVGLLGILKAGGAYVPLDPNYPQQRLSYMLSDSDVQLLLTQKSLLESLPSPPAKVVCLDTDWGAIERHSQENLEVGLGSEHLAYVIYTSGSTGQPKGVLVAHRNLVNAYFAWEEAYQLKTAARKHLQMANFSFDVFTGDLVRALCSGGKLVLCPTEYLLAAEKLYELMLWQEIDCAEFVPAVLRNLMEYLNQTKQDLNFMKVMVVGSDSWYIEEHKKLRDLCSEKTRVINSYGVTEATVDSCYFENTSTQQVDEKLVPIGNPFANTQIYILDSQLQPLPIGIAGELHIGGNGLTRGYLNRPELTCEKFIPNPFMNSEFGDSSRLYKTGDLARYLPDGNIEFLGRIDSQVKIRGFRIEPCEIEAVLAQHPNVRDAVVIAWEKELSHKSLVAYAVADFQAQESNDSVLNSELQTEQLSQWKAVFDDLYEKYSPEQELKFNIEGWESSYTRTPMLPSEVAEWIEQTVARINALNPSRVLELGCGSGLTLFRVAPHCTHYHATDLSEDALGVLQHQLDLVGQDLPVTLQQRGADNFEGIESDSFDSVLVVSVLQYFPNFDYLLRVLEGAVNAVKPGGFIYLADLRSLSLLELFHSSVQLYQASSSLPIKELKQRVHKQLLSEKQMVVDPLFFKALQQRLPKISHVEIQLERGHHQNELTKFRYDAILYIGGESVNPEPQIAWLDWKQENLSISSVRHLLVETKPNLVGIAGVPNARIFEDLQALQLLKNTPEGLETVGELRQVLQNISEDGVDPEEFWNLAEDLPYRIHITWSESSENGDYDVVLKRRETEVTESGREMMLNFSRQPFRPKPLSNYVHQPLPQKALHGLESKLRSFLQEKLPSHMVPTAFVTLDSLPLTPNGKVDRKALPAPDGEINREQEYIAPRTPTEEIVANIFAEVLDVQNVGIYDNFFELGGHSLLATRITSQIRKVFSLELPIRSLFEYPTIKELAHNIELEKQRQTNSTLPSAIEIISRDGELPLSFAQQRQWFLAQLEPNNPWYNISAAVKVEGNLDIQRFQHCFDVLVERQEILRTGFATVDGKAKLIIKEQAKINVTVVDLTNLTAKEKQQQVEQLRIDDAQHPFSLDRCPLMRVKLLTLDDDEYVLLLSMHHIISDGWSTGVLIKELNYLYSNLSRYSLIEEQNTIQYVDYAAWERKWLEGEIKDRQLDYWQQQLADTPIISSFPTDYPRKAELTHTGSSYDFQISDRITQSLKQISQNTGSTFFITIFSALALLLHRYTGNEDLVIGTPIANRNRSEIEGLIGFFVNTLALRVNLSGNPSFKELLTRARETALGAYAHSNLPFEQLIDHLSLQRSLSHTPLFQVMLVLQDQAGYKIEIGDLNWQPLKRVVKQAKFEMTFILTETDKGLQGSIEYNQSLFTADTIHRLAGHFRTLLTSIATNPEQNISDIAILSKGELKQLLVNFNNTDSNVVIDTCIHQLFAQQANLTPNAVAVVSKEEELTYQELNNRANDWANYLQSLGVKPETKVGLMLDRSTTMIVALLAILKAGGCYVPLDPNYPQTRLDYIVEDTQLNILLTETKYRGKLNTDNLTVIESDINQGESHQGASPSGETLFSSRETRPTKVSHLAPLQPLRTPAPLHPSSSTPENLAYIIYTSGSTGTPKGVAIPHRGVVRLVKDPNYVNLDETVITLQAAPLSFDASTFEIWGALLNGGRVVMLANTMPSLAELAENIITYQINTLWLTAGLFHLMVDEQLESLGNVRQLLAGGDVLSSRHIQRFLETHPQCSLINGYGPTESTTFACCYPMNKDSEIDIDRSTIGYPISHTQLYILDNYFNPVPVGVPGELHIGGAGLARNYLHRPELTAEKFIPNPFVETFHETSLLYKTGDLVRYLGDGKIEYLGRIDNQVKIRGFRVELGEIETTLNQAPDIKENVVLVIENSQGNKQLVAYIVPHNLDINQEHKWRSFLQERLPEYLIPSIFVTLDRLPLTANGKIDREALLDKEIILPQTTENSLQPQTEIEQTLAKIWSQILGLETVSINDTFFSLGGDSILAIQIIAKANQAGLKLTPKQLFQYQTIAELAQVTTTAEVNHAEQGLVTGIVPLTPIQSWFFAFNLANVNHFNQSVLLKTKQDLDLSIFQRALHKILIHHDALRIRFEQTDKGWQQSNQDVIQSINIQTIDLANLAKEQQTKAITQECDRLQASLDISAGSTIKIAYFNLGKNQDNRLLIIIHHLLIDGVSWRILLEDLQTAYQQELKNQVIQLPAKTTSYQQWSEYLREYTQNNNFQADIIYWLNQEITKDWSLPIEQISNHDTVASEKTITSSLDRELTQALLQEIHQTYNTQINDILLTSLAKTFANYTNQPNLLIDLESQGRTASNINLDISRTVGWFTNIFPVFLDLGTTVNLGEQIKTIKEQLRQVQNHSFNYGIIRYLQSDKSIRNQLKQLPSAQISFNYLGQFDNLNSASSLFELAQESSGLTSATNNRRSHLIAINSSVINGQLQMQWSYNKTIHQAETITNLANNFTAILEQIINHCQSSIGGYTPSDFSLAELEQDNLDLVLDTVDFGDFDE